MLIGQLLVVHDRDMEEWVQDPEGYFHSLDEKMNWEDDLRSCADQFLTTLLEQHRAAAMPVVVELMQETLEVVLKTDSQALQVPTAPLRRRAAASGRPRQQSADSCATCLQRTSSDQSVGHLSDEMGVHPTVLREACFRVAGHSAYFVAELVDFTAWYSGSLASIMVASEDPEQKLLRRRVLWMLAQWCGAGAFDAEMRHCLYATLLQQLQVQHAPHFLQVPIDGGRSLKFAPPVLHRSRGPCRTRT